MGEIELFSVALELPPLVLRDDDDFLSDSKDHICIIEKRDLIGLIRNLDYSDRFNPNTNGVNLSDILDKNGIVDISDMNFDNILLENFSNEMNEILGPILALDILDEQISIIDHKYHARSLEYLVHNAWDYI